MLVRYPARADGRGPHEGFSVLEFQFRLLAILANAALRAEKSSDTPQLPRIAGLGEWISYLRVSTRALRDSPGPAGPRFSRAVDSALNAYDAGGSHVGTIGDLKRLRDHLSHGGPLPDDLQGRAILDRLIDDVSSAIIDLLQDAILSYGISKTGLKRPILAWSDSKVSLWPGMFMKAHTWHVFARQVNDASATYMTYDGTTASSNESSPEILEALASVLRAKRNRGPFQSYIQDVLEDLKGFAENNGIFEASEIEDGFEVVWDKATSEGSEARRDYFRLGRDDRREWQSSDEWLPYSAYLRTLTRWRMVASRLYQTLLSTQHELDEEEISALGWSRRSATSARRASVEISDLAGATEKSCSFSAMMRDVDSDLESNRGQTQVVFLNGEAGIGKTRAMLDAALARAKTVAESDPDSNDSELPLYLFVQSTGQVLDNLNTVVAGAVVKTRILTDDGVKALCRNGLMTILIDGFDELLGNARYGDALGSLRPWLSSLGGRGVMIVSARSSYYVGQYRSSLLRAQKTDFPLVRHRIAEMQKWTPDEVSDFVRVFGYENELKALSLEDQRLLRLPFFARVFIEMCEVQPTGGPGRAEAAGDGISLAEYLLDQYVAREETKIRGLNGGSILSQAEMKLMFCFLAELMDEQSEREADEEVLQMAAQLAIGADLQEREGLTERLPALCGLSVAGGTDSLRFRFQHELFFDQFLAGAAARYLADSHEQAFFRILSNSAWGRATVTVVLAKAGVDKVATTLTGYAERFNADTEQGRLVLRTNVGALWSETIRLSGSMKFDVSAAVFADPLDLSTALPGWLRISQGEIDQIRLPPQEGWEISLRESIVRRLDARTTATLAGLKGIDSQHVHELLCGGRLIERRDEIKRKLLQLGAQVDPSTDEHSDTTRSELTSAAEFYLGSFHNRAEYSIILDQKTLLPAEEHPPRWTGEFGKTMWQRFVNAMIEAGVAAVETFNSSGSAKYKFRLSRAAGQILARDSAHDEISAFWAAVE